MASVIHGFIYNKDAFTELGLSVPGTQAEFFDVLDKIKADGADIRFIDDDGTELAYEIEAWDDTAKTASIWVKVKSLEATNSDFIHLYYNNSAASAAQNASAVWDADYQAVWHLNELQAAGTHVDSTGVNDATRVGNTSGTGQIDGGQLFDGSNDYIDAGSVADNIDVTKGTVSGWVELSSSSVQGFLFHAGVDANNLIALNWKGNDSGFRFIYTAGGDINEVHIDDGNIIDEDDGKQHFVALTWDKAADEVKVFIDGAQYGSTLTGLGVWSGSIGTGVGIGGNKVDSVAYLDEIGRAHV
jgi:hypothetical protein